MGNEQIWIKSSEETEYNELMDKLTLFYEELVNYNLGFKPHQCYKVIKGNGHKRGRRIKREEIGRGFVIMDALRYLRQKQYEFLKNNPWPRDYSEGYFHALRLLRPETELRTQNNPKTSFQEWLEFKNSHI